MDQHLRRLQGFRGVGSLSEADASHAHALMAQTGEPLDQVLTKLGLLTELEIAAGFARDAGVELASSVTDPALPDAADGSLDAQLNPHFLRNHRILPVGQRNGHVIAAMVDPADLDARQGLAFALDAPVLPVVVPASLFERLYGQRFAANDADEAAGIQDVSADADRIKDMASAAPVVRLVSRLITDAAEARASDIHIEPGAREAIVRQRIDGVLRETARLPAGQAMAAISRVKVLAELDIAERRRAQDGRLSFPVAGRAIDLRVSVVPTDHGESLVVRLLDPEAGLRNLGSLGFLPALTSVARDVLARPNGILLVTGPTGSGKTTTLYAFLRHLADGERKILTIEDPIEYRLAGISQSQVSPAIGLGFASALRSFLRHDPDVIMVGEIRDAETARTAIQAALTGHLVLSTLHTNDAPSAVTRLVDMGVEPYLIASTLIGAFAQRLVRTICPDCEGAGCQRCAGSGLSGRVAIAEGFQVDDEIKALIRSGADEGVLRTALARKGFTGMAEDGQAKIAAGVTRLEEVSRAVGRHE